MAYTDTYDRGYGKEERSYVYIPHEWLDITLFAIALILLSAGAPWSIFVTSVRGYSAAHQEWPMVSTHLEIQLC